MKHQIEKLEAQLKELKAVYENEQRLKYETSGCSSDTVISPPIISDLKMKKREIQEKKVMKNLLSLSVLQDPFLWACRLCDQNW